MSNIHLSTAYFPPVAWFAAAQSATIVSIEANEHYIKQTWRNRCSILTANGVLPLSIPTVKRSGEKMPIQTVEISYATNWQRMHWNAIVSAYNKSPYFEYFAHEFEIYFKEKTQYLFDLNLQIIKTLFSCLNLTIPIVATDDFLPLDPENKFDFRYTITPKLEISAAFPQYYQVFGHRYDFVPNLSMLDLLFNEGPDGLHYAQINN